MMRTSMIVSMLLCGALGFSLYRVAYEVQNLESELARLNRQMAADQEEKHVLSTEWSFLTQPTRLSGLANRHLDLRPLTTAQIGSFDTLPLKGEGPATSPVPPTTPKDDPTEKILAAMQVAENVSPAPTRGHKIATAKPELFQ